MTDVYYKTFKVPMWAVVGGAEETVSAVCNWLDKAEAREQIWPIKGFYEHIFTYKDKYIDYFKDDGTLKRPSFDFIARAAAEYLQLFMQLDAGLSIPHKAHHLNRDLKSEMDAMVWLDAVIEMFDDLRLSQLFQVIKHSYREDKPRYALWYTKAPCGMEVIKRISNKVITIGDDPRCDIDVSGLKGKKLSAKLEENFSQLMQGVKK